MLISITRFILSIILFLTTFLSNAQIMFQKHYGGSGDDRGFSVIQTTDGGYLIAGFTDWGGGSAGTQNIYLIKTNEYGDTTWTKHYGGYYWDEIQSIIEGTDSNYYATGYTEYAGGTTDMILMCISPDGDSLWLKTYGGARSEMGLDIIQCQDGGFIMVGVTSIDITDFSSFYAVRTNSIGDTLWTKTYDKRWEDWAYSVIQTSDNGFLIGGSTTTGGDMAYDICVLKTDSIGDTLWTKVYGGSNYDRVFSICKTNDENYLLFGTTLSYGAGASDMYAIKTDTSGAVIWERTYGGTSYEGGSSCIETAFGVVLTGTTFSYGSGGDVYMVAIDHNGDTLWTHVYGDANENDGYCIKKTNDGGYIILADTRYSSGFWDPYLIKTAADGFAGLDQIKTESIELFIYPNPCSGILSLNSPLINGSDVIIEVFNSQGNIVMEKYFGKTNLDFINLDVLFLQSGVYVLKLTTKHHNTSTKLIIE